MNATDPDVKPDIPEPPDAEALLDLPRILLTPKDRLYRVHGAGREPNYFSFDRFGRFNPPPRVSTFGTCYCSASDEGGFIEVLGHGSPVVSGSDLTSREMSTLRPAELELADFTDPLVLGRFGITGTISAGGRSTYPACQRWAAALFENGLRGIRYRARHDPSLQHVSYAIFGEPGVDYKPLTVDVTHALEPPEYWSDLLRRYGFNVMPPAPLP